jgi:thiol-disulfide isomerase/thioredoxin
MDRQQLKRWATATAVLGFGAALAVGMVLLTQIGPETGHFRSAGPRPLPPLHFTDGDGRPMTLASFAGRVVLLNLWATWCAPCVRELPSLDRLQASLGGPDFQVVALAEDRGGAATVLPFLKERQIRALSAYLDAPGMAPTALETDGLPTTLLIDRQGREVGWMLGGTDWDAGPARHAIEALIGRAGPETP